MEQIKTDQVNHPVHYNQGTVECIEAMKETFGPQAVQDFCICNAMKYLWRCKNKNNLRQDLEKCIWYVNYALKIEDLAYTDD